MSKASLVATFGVILGFVSCAKTDSSSLQGTNAYGDSKSWQGDSYASDDECEAPSPLGGGATTDEFGGFSGGDQFEDFGGEEIFSLAGASPGKVGDAYKPVKSAGDNVIVDMVGGPIGSAIIPDSFKASACNTGWFNSSRAEAVRLMSSFQSCFHAAKTKKCFVVKREDLIAECRAQFNDDVANAGLSEGCTAYMQGPNLISQLERSVSTEWIKPSGGVAQVGY